MMKCVKRSMVMTGMSTSEEFRISSFLTSYKLRITVMPYFEKMDYLKRKKRMNNNNTITNKAGEEKNKRKKGDKKRGKKEASSLDPIESYSLPDEKAKGRKVKSLFVEVKESHAASIHFPLKMTDDSGIIHITAFSACDATWTVAISYNTIDDEDFLSLSLINLSDGDVTISYGFSVLHPSDSSRNYRWTDPEGFVTFSSQKDHNSEWGNDEFIELNELDSFVTDGIFRLMVDVCRLTSNTNLTDQSLQEEIEKISGETELIRLANADIIPLIKKLPPTRDLRQQARQEDRIVTSFK